MKKIQSMELEFPLNKKSDEEVVDTLVQLIAEQLSTEKDLGDESRNKHLVRIKDTDPDSYEQLEKFLEAFTVYSFLKNDRDLRLKGMDVWKKEKERHQQDFKARLDKLLKLVDEKKWDIGPVRTDLHSI
jgi:hypothetical protein